MANDVGIGVANFAGRRGVILLFQPRVPFEPVLRRSLVDDLDHLVEELIAEDMAGYRDELVEDPALFLFCTPVRRAIIGLIAQRTGMRKRPFCHYSRPARGP